MPTILLIDDSSSCQQWLAGIVPSIPCELLSLRSCELPARQADCAAAQLILVALLLQQDNGFELGARLRAAGCERIVLVNDKFRDSDLSWACALGFAGLLRIPAPVSWVASELRRYLDCGTHHAGA